MRSMLLYAVLAGATTGLAQNLTVPALQTGVEGTGSTSIPFGYNQPVRVMYLYDGAELPWQGPRVIDGLFLRADNTDPGVTAFYAKQYITLGIRMSTTTRGALNAANEFDSNHGMDVTEVLPSTPIALPAQPAQPGVRAGNVALTFQQPWVYGLTPAHQNELPTTLVVDLAISSQPSGAYRLDNLGACDGQITAFGSLGAGCLANRSGGPGNPVTISAPTTMLAGANYVYTVGGAPPNAQFMLLLSVTTNSSFLGQTVPVPLFDPTNPLLSNPNLPLLEYPAPDCWIDVGTDVTYLGMTNSAGIGYLSVPLPAGRQYVGHSLYAQAIVRDQTANQMMLVTTMGMRSTVCGPLGVNRIFHVGNHLAATGQATPGQAAIFDVQ